MRATFPIEVVRCAKSPHAQRLGSSIITVRISKGKGDSLSAFLILPHQYADLAIRERHAPDPSGSQSMRFCATQRSARQGVVHTSLNLRQAWVVLPSSRGIPQESLRVETQRCRHICCISDGGPPSSVSLRHLEDR
jgi:hypothetical protein